MTIVSALAMPNELAIANSTTAAARACGMRSVSATVRSSRAICGGSTNRNSPQKITTWTAVRASSALAVDGAA